MHHHVMRISSKYLDFIENGKKTYLGRPLYYKGEEMWKKTHKGDTITFQGDNKSVDVMITQVFCHPSDLGDVLGFFLKGKYKEDLPDVISREDARKKYISDYGEETLSHGIIEIHWKLINKINWD